MLKRLTTISIFLILLLGASFLVPSVAEANNAPVVQTSIPNQTVQVGGSNVTFNAIQYFSDPDGDPLHVAATETDIPGQVETVKVTKSLTSLTLEPKAAGSATVKVWVSDHKGLKANQTFSIKVNAAPAASGTIPDSTIEVGGTAHSVNVSTYFTDANNDTLTYTVASSNTAAATVSLSDTTLTVTAVARGSTTITVTATDPHGTSADQTFSVTVTKPDGPPTPVGTVPDQKLKVGGGFIMVNTTSYFAEIPAAVGRAYSVQSSNSGIVKADGLANSTYNGPIWVTLTPVAAGSATITVTVTDAQGSGQQSFTTTVYDGPVAVGTIPGVTFTSNGSTSDVGLSPYFDAFDTSDLTWTVVSSDTAKATVSLSGTTVTVTSVAAGTSTITARAMDSVGKSATQSFTVTVKGPPVAVGSIPAQTLEVGGAAVTINVSGYFTDPDGGTLTYTSILYGAVTIDFDLAGSILTITPPKNLPYQTGSGTIRIRATDPDSLSATQEFSVTLILANRAPATSGTIPDSSKRVGESAYSVDLSGYFTDADEDTLIYSAVSSDTAKATVSLSDATLTVTPVAVGTSTITATATDPNGAFATQTFTMTVTQANRAPVASQTIPNYTINRSDASAIPNVALGDYFSDPDGDALTYTATTPVGSNIVWPHFGSGASTLTLAPTDPASVIASGTVTVTVTASDGNASVTQSFSVTTSRQPTAVGTIPTQYLLGEPNSLDVQSYFNDGDSDALTYTVSSSNTSAVTVSVSGSTVTFSNAGQGSATITITATDPTGFAATQTVTVYIGGAPTAVGTIPNISGALNQVGGNISLTGYFSHPQGLALTYSATSSDTSVVLVNISGTNLQVTPQRTGSATITVTATSSNGLSATQSFSVNFTETVFVGEADAVAGLSGAEQSLLGSLLTYDTIIFNELHNGSDDANDWLELRNVSNVDIPLDTWQLKIQTGTDTAIVALPAGTVIPAGEVLLLANTEIAPAAVVIESFVLPQTEFALILRSPTAFGDLAGNYFQTQKERPETAPELTVDAAWERVEATTSGYRAEAWAESTHRNGLGSPGYQPSALAGDLNHDGVVNILDLVLIASQFGTTGPSAADLNADNTVNIQDLVLVANAFNNAAAAPSAKQPTAALVNTWLQLAQQNAASNVQTSLPKGFSYTRGIQVLEQLARALTPDTTALLANYPNPFNPETWIPYQLSKAADVTISIYASDGNVVRTLALGHQAAGIYKNRTQAAYWDGKNALGESVASGLYFYTLTAGDFTATRRMLILK